MSAWDLYEKRVGTSGNTKREAALIREKRLLNNKISDSLSYHSVTIDDISRKVAIINTDYSNEKYIFSNAHDEIYVGGLVNWMDSHWLITECDVNSEVYTKARMVQCNHLLSWIDNDGVIRTQWCVIQDTTKYLTGEYEDRNFVVTRGDTRIGMIISKNQHTLKFSREHRFLIDDSDAETKISYQLTKPLKLMSQIGNTGIYSFVLQEVPSTDFDNHQLGVADYYKYYPKDTPNGEDVGNNIIADSIISPETTKTKNGKEGWL